MKQPILGRDFLAENRLVENYAGRFLTQIQTDLFIPAVVNRTRQVSHVNQVPGPGQPSSEIAVERIFSSYKSQQGLQPQHGVGRACDRHGQCTCVLLPRAADVWEEARCHGAQVQSHARGGNRQPQLPLSMGSPSSYGQEARSGLLAPLRGFS